MDPSQPHITAQAQLALLQEMVDVLSTNTNLQEATINILKAIGIHCGWQIGTLWITNDYDNSLCHEGIWQADPSKTQALANATLQENFNVYSGLPGASWRDEKPVWLKDASNQETFTRFEAANTSGIRSGLAFPVQGAHTKLGIMEFLSAEEINPDKILEELLTTLGRQVGQYIEQRRSDEVIRANEAQKTSILASALDSIISINSQGNIIQWNPAAERTFGYSYQEALGQKLTELVLPKRIRSNKQYRMEHLLYNEPPVLNTRIETVAMRRDGSEFPIELTITRQQPETPARFTSYIRDLSVEKEVQSQLNLILEGVADGVTAITPAGELAYINPVGQRIFNMDENGEGASEHRTYYDEDGVAVDAHDLPTARALRGESRAEQVLRLDMGGSDQEVWLRFKASPVFGPDNRVLLAICIFEDVSEDRRAAQALRQSQAQFEAVLEGVADGITVQDRQGELVYCNDAAARMYKFSDGQALTKAGRLAIYDKFSFFIDDKEISRTYTPYPFKPGVQDPPRMVRMVEKDTGKMRWLQLKSAPVYSTSGVVELTINIFDDVTEARSFQEKLQSSRDELQAILEGVGDSITAIGVDGTTMYANPAALEALGCKTVQEIRDAPTDKLLKDLNFQDEDGFPFPVEELPHYLVGQLGHDSAEAIVQYNHAVRGPSWGQLRTTAIRDEQGNLLMSLIITADITAQKSEESKLRSVADTLQASILPSGVPSVPHMELAVAFAPRGGTYHEVGGDFYDVFAADDDSWMFVTGDVCGKGPEAAAVTSLCRYSIRALAMKEQSPAVLLGDLNEALIRHREDGRFATVAIARGKADENGINLCLALGGHPQPYVLRENGEVEEVGLPGTLVGAFRVDVFAEETNVQLNPGDTLVFFTDGVTEARNSTGEMFDLAGFLEHCKGMGAEEIASTIEAAVLAYQDTAARDDVALLVVKAPRTLLKERFVAEPESVPQTRRCIETLQSKYPDAPWDSIKLMVTELATNAIKHGINPGGHPWFELIVTECDDERLRFSVIDSGRPFEPIVTPASPDSTSGRGLFLVDALSKRWGTDEHFGACVWFECDTEEEPAS